MTAGVALQMNKLAASAARKTAAWSLSASRREQNGGRAQDRQCKVGSTGEREKPSPKKMQERRRCSDH